MSANVARKNNRNTVQYVWNGKIVDSWKVLVVRRKQILAYVYILSIKNTTWKHQVTYWKLYIFLIRSFGDFIPLE